MTSVRVDTRGTHEWITIWIEGRNVGTLTVGKGDGERLRRLLMPERGAPRVGCPCGACDTCWRNAGCPSSPPPWGAEARRA